MLAHDAVNTLNAFGARVAPASAASPPSAGSPGPRGPGRDPAAAGTTKPETVPTEILLLVQDILLSSPVARNMGVLLDILHIDHVELVLPFRVDNVTQGNVIHGGVIATLIDIAGAAAAASGADPATLQGGATASLTVHYVAPAANATLRGVAEVVRRGRRQVVTEVAVYAETADSGVLAAKALMTSTLM